MEPGAGDHRLKGISQTMNFGETMKFNAGTLEHQEPFEATPQQIREEVDRELGRDYPIFWKGDDMVARFADVEHDPKFVNQVNYSILYMSSFSRIQTCDGFSRKHMAERSSGELPMYLPADAMDVAILLLNFPRRYTSSGCLLGFSVTEHLWAWHGGVKPYKYIRFRQPKYWEVFLSNRDKYTVRNLQIHDEIRSSSTTKA